jgi:hypothetical protein
VPSIFESPIGDARPTLFQERNGAPSASFTIGTGRHYPEEVPAHVLAPDEQNDKPAATMNLLEQLSGYDSDRGKQIRAST